MMNTKTDDMGLDDLRTLIDEIARRRLPDRSLCGILAGREDEIRQNTATMLVVEGFMHRNVNSIKTALRRDRFAAMIHLDMVVAIALRRCRKCLIDNHIKDILKSS